MNKKNIIIPVVILVLAFVFTACKPDAASTPSPVEIATRVAATSQAKATGAAVEQLIAKVTELSKPTNTPEPTVCIIPTPIPQPTAIAPTASASGTPAAANPTVAGTPNPSSSNSAKHFDKSGKCTFSFEFLGEPGAVQTGTTVTVSKVYAKQWKLKNTGTCAWAMDKDKDADHFLYLQAEGGTTLSYPDGLKRPNIKLCIDRGDPIQPGEECVVEVTFFAPAEGKYIDYWNVMTPLGEFLGYGPNGNWSLGINVSAAK